MLVAERSNHEIRNMSEENEKLRAELAEICAALRRIAELRYSEAGEPFDDALDIADAALKTNDAKIAKPREQTDIGRLLTGYERYETVRRMRPDQFKAAINLSISTGKSFDQIIDELKAFRMRTE